MKEEKATLQCLFCDSKKLIPPKDRKPASGDLILCLDCGEENDFDSLVAIAKKKSVEKVKEELEQRISKIFKK